MHVESSVVISALLLGERRKLIKRLEWFLCSEWLHGRDVESRHGWIGIGSIGTRSDLRKLWNICSWGWRLLYDRSAWCVLRWLRPIHLRLILLLKFLGSLVHFDGFDLRIFASLLLIF